MEEGCSHSRAASDAQVEAFGAAVRLQLARLLQRFQFRAACSECGNTSTPTCCLECDFIGCSRHADPHGHALGCCLGSEVEGALWCFKCHDVVVDQRFERRAQAELRRALRAAPQQLSQNGQSGSAAAGKKPPFHASRGLRGLVNLGATCYMSVVLQSLVHNPLVRAFFLGGGHEHEACERPSCLACSVDRLYSNFFASPSVLGYAVTDLIISMAEKKPLMGAGSTEQDAHEFYLMLLDDFHSAHLDSPLGAKNEDGHKCGCVAHRSFAGSTESTLSCTCGQRTRRWEPIVDVGLDLNTDPRAGITTLDQALTRFTTAEMIANYTCENCGLQNTTSKQLKLSELPPALMIQLKRFKHLGARGSMKVDSPVEFGLQIDMGPYTSVVPHGNVHSPDERTVERGRLIYELFGVICHTGTLDTGHYTCMMKHSSGQWYNFDDTTVTTIDVDRVMKAKDAYLLYYVVKWAV